MFMYHKGYIASNSDFNLTTLFHYFDYTFTYYKNINSVKTENEQHKHNIIDIHK